ncbi:hypothetical protein GCM10007874_55950 [Labrys miyagiensis]|uniref:DUF2199 domain-containing protein n=1 Tax=Labrys miyagiensis TaxID=346912 RepID=A0ABQ6CQG2_9HYPH|nr:hypothetical protein GCM10007874_55950 [Labrys miyagiensis]
MPLDLGCEAPSYWDATPEAERGPGSFLNSELCLLRRGEDVDYFMRGCLALPIIGMNENFVFGLWTSLSRQNFDRAIELNNEAVLDPDEGNPFGWLSNAVPGFPNCLNLKLRVHHSPHPQRPFFELEPSDHPLAIAQRVGISTDDVVQIVAPLISH